MKKIAIFMALAAAFVFAGPVSYYGKLQARNGALYGSKSGTEQVQLKGMSMYWDFWAGGYPFYNSSIIDALVDKWKVEIIRVAHGTASADQGTFERFNWKSYDDAVIQAAIDNDIYVIIDYHSHYANRETEDAKSFFSYMANKWGGYPNVIFEIFNEPMGGNGGDAVSWNNVKEYANTVIPVIRNNGGTDNLIVVGNTQWSAHPEDAVGKEVTDAGANTAYTFHFYANTHSLASFKSGINTAMQNGLTVFVTEWGVGTADGQKVNNTTDAADWMNYLDEKKISWCNWSVTNIGGAGLDNPEASAAFQGQSSYTNPSNWEYSGYSTSGKFVYNQLSDHALSAPWRNASTSSSSVASSNSQAEGFTEFIDDFEDGDGIAFTGGSWYAYTDEGKPGDENGNGASTITNDKDEEGYIVVISGDNSTEGMAALTGIELNAGTYIYDPYVSLGLNLTEDESVYDLSSCTKFTYQYKGAAHTFKAQTPDVMDYNYHTTDLIASTAWKTATVNWSDLQQANWGKNSPKVTLDHARIDKFAWTVTDVSDAAYLYIDNFRCVDGAIEIVSSSSANSSSSSKPKSSSSSHVNPTCEDGETIDVGSTHMLCVDGEWTEVQSSSSSAAVSTFAMIDDFEDGDNVANTGKKDYWYAFTDVNNNPPGKSTISNSKSSGEYVVVFATAAAGGSEYGAGLTGISLKDGDDFTVNDKPSVTLAVDIKAGLAGCTEISYKYKGAGHNLKAVMNGDADGSLTGYNYHKAAVEGSSSWATASVPVSSLKQEKYWGETATLKIANVVSLQWEVKGTASPAYLYIDDVQCAGMTIASSSSSGTVVSSSSAAAECTEGEEIHVGSSDLKCVDGKWTDMNASSSSSSPNSSASTPGIALIDDFQDENTQAESLGEAYWYIYKAGGSVTNKQDTKTQSWDMVRIDGENAYVAMEGISGITYGATTYPSVGMGLDIPTRAFTNCTAITYDYRGSAHKFRASVSTVTPDEGYEHVTDIQPKATTWTPVTVTAADLKQPTWIPATEKKTFSWAQVVKMAWVVDEKIANADRGTNLDVDNVTCIGSLPTPKSSSSVKPKSSSSVKPVSSSSAGVKPGSSSGANNGGAGNNGTNNGSNNGNINGNDNGYGMAIGDIASPAGLDASIMGKTLVVSVARAGLVKVQVFDMMGHAIESHSESMAAGSFAHDFAKLGKGAYIVRVRQGSMVKTLRMQVR